MCSDLIARRFGSTSCSHVYLRDGLHVTYHNALPISTLRIATSMRDPSAKYACDLSFEISTVTPSLSCSAKRGSQRRHFPGNEHRQLLFQTADLGLSLCQSQPVPIRRTHGQSFDCYSLRTTDEVKRRYRYFSCDLGASILLCNLLNSCISSCASAVLPCRR